MEQVSVRGRRFWPSARRSTTAVLLWMCTAIATDSTMEAAEQSLEYQVKAAFLLNFTKFIDWPAGAFTDADSPLAICVVGKDPFRHTLDDILQGEVVSRRKLIVRRIGEAPAARTCQVVFLSAAEKDVRIAFSTLGPGVLTVGEGEGFLREGGMITFVVENRRVRFDINQTAAENASLKISSRLLSVARSVTRVPPQ
jgi:uncharacterized protein DUF4154